MGYSSQAEANAKGWFSRRHKSNRVHMENRDRLRDLHEAKFESVKERQAARATMTPQQQIDRLDRLLGVGVGAKKERARLEKQIQ